MPTDTEVKHVLNVLVKLSSTDETLSLETLDMKFTACVLKWVLEADKKPKLIPCLYDEETEQSRYLPLGYGEKKIKLCAKSLHPFLEMFPIFDNNNSEKDSNFRGKFIRMVRAAFLVLKEEGRVGIASVKLSKETKTCACGSKVKIVTVDLE